MRYSLLVSAFCLFLSGCGSFGGLRLGDGTPVTQALVLAKCPSLKGYTTDQLKAAANELGGLPTESEVAMMIGDYGQLRKACRALSAAAAKQQ